MYCEDRFPANGSQRLDLFGEDAHVFDVLGVVVFLRDIDSLLLQARWLRTGRKGRSWRIRRLSGGDQWFCVWTICSTRELGGGGEPISGVGHHGGSRRLGSRRPGIWGQYSGRIRSNGERRWKSDFFKKHNMVEKIKHQACWIWKQN